MPLKRAISVRHKKATASLVPKWRRTASEEIGSLESDQVGLGEMRIDDEKVVVEKFLNLLANEAIQSFFQFDRCRVYTNRWALARVAVYYCRLKDAVPFTEEVFFELLYLANDMISDAQFHFILFAWALQHHQLHINRTTFQNHKDALWSMLNYRAHVSLVDLEKIIQHAPQHHAWRRTCQSSHQEHLDNSRLVNGDFEFDFPLPVFDTCELCQFTKRCVQANMQTHADVTGMIFGDLLPELTKGST